MYAAGRLRVQPALLHGKRTSAMLQLVSSLFVVHVYILCVLNRFILVATVSAHLPYINGQYALLTDPQNW